MLWAWLSENGRPGRAGLPGWAARPSMVGLKLPGCLAANSLSTSPASSMAATVLPWAAWHVSTSCFFSWSVAVSFVFPPFGFGLVGGVTGTTLPWASTLTVDTAGFFRPFFGGIFGVAPA